jgi:hypothetical protein
LAAVLALVLLLGGCASDGAAPSAGQPLAPGVFLNLPDAPAFRAGLDVTQLVTARYQQRQQMFQSFIRSDKGQLTVLMTVPSGPRIMRIDWRVGAIQTKKEPLAPADLSAARMLADIMLVYAPLSELQTAIAGGTVSDEDDGVRKVKRNGETVIVVTRPQDDVWQGHATLKNLAFDYSLSIQSRRMAP